MLRDRQLKLGTFRAIVVKDSLCDVRKAPERIDVAAHAQAEVEQDNGADDAVRGANDRRARVEPHRGRAYDPRVAYQAFDGALRTTTGAATLPSTDPAGTTVGAVAGQPTCTRNRTRSPASKPSTVAASHP